MITKTYLELSHLESFIDRYEYLKLNGIVGKSTFGFDRWINQRFYKSREWQSARDYVIVRDGGCDLGVAGFDIHHGLLVHHMNPISVNDLEHGNEWIIDPNYLITTSLRTHNAIHYGDESLLPRAPVTRRFGDTHLW
jgi:hypothetical protein